MDNKKKENFHKICIFASLDGSNCLSSFKKFGYKYVVKCYCNGKKGIFVSWRNCSYIVHNS